MTALRAKKDSNNPYTMISNRLAQDRTISWEARGVMLYLLSRPDDWVVSPTDLEQQCGRQKVFKILRELVEAGYIHREQPRNEDGTMGAVMYFIYESPCDEKPHTVQPYTEKPRPVNHTLQIKESTKERKSQKKESTKNLSEPAVEADEADADGENPVPTERDLISEFSFLGKYIALRGKPNGTSKAIRTEIHRIGPAMAREVIGRCEQYNAGAWWPYVLSALRNAVVSPPSSAAPPSSERSRFGDINLSQFVRR